MTLAEFMDKMREVYEGNERDLGPTEVKVGMGVFEMPFEDVVFKGGKCVLCDAFAAREVR